MPRRIRPGRVRRRLAVAFVAVAGLSAGVLAVGSYLRVQQDRLSESLDRAKTSVQFQLGTLAPSFLPLTVERNVDELLRSFEHADQHVVLVIPGGTAAFASNSSFAPPIPPGLAGVVRQGDL